MEKDLDYEFIRINPVLIKKVLMSMLKLVKYTITLKNLLNKISKRLWKLEFKSDHLMKLNALIMLSKKHCHHYKAMKTYCLSCKKIVVILVQRK